MKCPECGTEFMPNVHNQKYCDSLGRTSDGRPICQRRARNRRRFKNAPESVREAKRQRYREWVKLVASKGLCVRCGVNKPIGGKVCGMCLTQLGK